MSKNLLHKAFTRNQELAGLVQAFAIASGAKIWVEDIHGTLLFGVPYSSPAHKVEVRAFGELLGVVCGGVQAPLVGTWLTQWATLEGGRKKLGAEILHLYREINLMFDFSEKLSTVRGIVYIAQLALEEAGRLIDFEQGAVIFQPNPEIPLQTLALAGADFNPNELIGQMPAGGSPEIIDLSGRDSSRWALFAALKVNYRPLGSMLLLRGGKTEFSAEDLKLLTSLALQTAAAMENALQYEAAAEKALELNREKLEKENLQQLDEMKSRFFANITHEFRTPLTVILGMASLPEEQLTEDIKERLAMIRRNGADMLRLVDQLLDLAKLETQALPLKFIHADVVLFIRQMMEPFHLFASGREVSLEFHSSVENLSMDFDSDKLQQILTNLLSNAVKFTPPGGRVQLAIERTGAPSQNLLFTISDTGVGIPEEDLPKVFDRFFQSETPIPHGHPGSGIGLAHARELARLMGGDITVKSALGVGSKFYFRLPVTEPAPGKEKPVAGTESSRPSPTGDYPLVLLIEDHPDLVSYLQTCLLPYYQIEVATDGNSGIAKALELIPDIIISDVMLPGAGGFEICETLKADERSSHIPIVLLTARADAQSKLEGLRHGADVYLGKPFELAELLLRLEKLLELRTKLQLHYSRAALSNSRPEKVDKTEKEDAFVEKLKVILEKNLSDENFALPELCHAIGMSRSQLFRKMKALVNEAPSSFIRMYRLHRAKELLERTDLQVSEIAYEVGFKDPAYFSFSFHEIFGMTPSSVRSE